MTRHLKVLLLLLLAAVTLNADAQQDTTGATSVRNFAPLADLGAKPDENPAPHHRELRAFHWGPFVNYGNGLTDRSDFRFLSAGVEAGKALTPVLHAGPLSGQFELAGNIMPVWSSFTPAPHTETKTCVGEGGQTYTCELPVGGGNYFGFSVTPVIFRWKFATPWKAVQPWFQGQGGVVYTTHKFPPDVLVVPGMPGGTSVWNFASGAGLGTHIFVSPKRSVDVHVNAIHLSSASLGDHNPGVNAQIQVQLGYTFWR